MLPQLMAIPLRSYIQPMIVMSVIPFGLVGAVLGHVVGSGVVDRFIIAWVTLGFLGIEVSAAMYVWPSWLSAGFLAVAGVTVWYAATLWVDQPGRKPG